MMNIIEDDDRSLELGAYTTTPNQKLANELFIRKFQNLLEN